MTQLTALLLSGWTVVLMLFCLSLLIRCVVLLLTGGGLIYLMGAAGYVAALVAGVVLLRMLRSVRRI